MKGLWGSKGCKGPVGVQGPKGIQGPMGPMASTPEDFQREAVSLREVKEIYRKERNKDLLIVGIGALAGIIAGLIIINL